MRGEAPRLLEAACATAGLDSLPTLPARMAAFVRGPLAEALLDVVDADEATRLTQHLCQRLGLEDVDNRLVLDSGIRPRRGHSMVPPSAEAPTVIVASAELSKVDPLIERLLPHARVVAAYDALALLSALQRHRRPLTVALDPQMPGLDDAVRETVESLLFPGSAVLESASFEVGQVATACLERIAAPSAPIERTVLIAHRDGAWRDNLGRVLQRAGWTTLGAPDGLTAFDRCVLESPAVAIIALDLPTLEGGELIGLLSRRAPEIAVVAIGEGAATLAAVTLAQISALEPREVLECLERHYPRGDEAEAV